MAYQSLQNTAIRTIRWEPDVIFDSYWFNKFIGLFIKHGKKLRAEKLVLNAVKAFKAQFKKVSFYTFFMNVLRQLRPVIGLGHRRLGLVFIHVPYVINSTRGIKIVYRWILHSVNKLTKRDVESRLLDTLIILYSPRLRKTMLQARHTYMENLQDSTRYTHFRWF